MPCSAPAMLQRRRAAQLCVLHCALLAALSVGVLDRAHAFLQPHSVLTDFTSLHEADVDLRPVRGRLPAAAGPGTGTGGDFRRRQKHGDCGASVVVSTANGVMHCFCAASGTIECNYTALCRRCCCHRRCCHVLSRPGCRPPCLGTRHAHAAGELVTWRGGWPARTANSATGAGWCNLRATR